MRARIIIILLIFIAIEAVMTYPLFLKASNHMPGFFSTDESYAVLWNAWLTKYAHLQQLSLKRTDFIAYPYGTVFYTSQPIGYLWYLISYILSIMTNPVLTYDIQVVVNLLFCTLFMFLLVYHLTRDNKSAFFSGVIFGFSPYLFVRSWQHLAETYLWMIPLTLFVSFRLKESYNLRLKLFFLLSFILITINNGAVYYAVVIFGLLVVYLSSISFMYKHIFRDHSLYKEYYSYLKRLFFICLPVLLLLFLFYFPVVLDTIFAVRNTAPSAQNPYFRPFEDLFTQSAKPLSYLLPVVTHPVFGKFTEQFIGSPLYGISFTEHALYLGWLPLLLSFVALKRYMRGKYSKVDLPWLKEERFYLGFFILLAVAAWFFSQPPWWQIGPLRIYMPSFFMYKVLPMFRAYCRFGIVVMFAVAVLAGFGLKFMLERFKSRRTRAAFTVLCCGLVLFEFWNWPPYKVIDVSRVPAAYYWLKAQSADTVIAEYPLDLVGPNELYKLYQTTHEKRMINGATPGTRAHDNLKTLADLSLPKTVAALKEMGVKYVLVHQNDYLKTELIEEIRQLEKIPFNRGLKPVRSFPAQECPDKRIRCIAESGPIDVYEVANEE